MDPHRLNWRHLSALSPIIDSGSVSAAARSVNLTQPAITQGIAKLEAQLATQLFQRVRGALVATPAAKLLAARADNALRMAGSRRATSAQIRAFVALARSGSYTGAAAATGLTEASLHRAVADLALTMGTRLVDRQGRGVTLTRRGAEIARNFRLALAELRSGIAELSAMRGKEVEQIVIGAMPLSRARLLPSALGRFHQDHPEVRFAVIEGSHAELTGPLRDGEIDVMLGALRNPPPGEDLAQTPLFVDRPVILARRGHPLATAGAALEPVDLIGYPWIIAPHGTPLRALWERMFAAAGVPAPRVPIQCGSVITIRQLLVEHDYLTLLSPDQVAPELAAGWLARVGPAPGIARTIGLTTRTDWRPTPWQAEFVDLLLRIGAGMTPRQ